MVQESINSAFGKFVWYDQKSLDLEGSGAFYEKVVGWTLKANDMNDQPYTVLMAGDDMVGGLMPIPADAAKMGSRPAWMGYVAVDDVDAYAVESQKRAATAWNEGLGRWRPVAKRTVRTHAIVMAPPGFDQDLGLGEAEEHLAVEQFVAKLAVEALTVAVLPGTAGRDVGGLGADRGDPFA